MNGTTVQAISTVVLSWKLAALCALGLAVLEDRIEHHAEHGDEDHRADDQHEVVQPLLVGGDLRDRRMQVELVDGRAAGQVVHGHAPACGRQRARQRRAGRPAPALPECSASSSSLSSFSFVDSSGQAGATPRASLPAPQRPRATRRPAARRSSGRRKRPTAMRWPCARQLDQRAVAVRGLDPHPRGAELDPLDARGRRRARPPGAPACRRMHLAVGGVAGIDQQRRADGQQLEPGERHDQRRAAAPEARRRCPATARTATGRRPHSCRGVIEQLRLQQPLHRARRRLARAAPKRSAARTARAGATALGADGRGRHALWRLRVADSA